MVDVRDCGGGGITDGFGKVESIMSRVRAGDEKPVDPMVSAVKKAPFPQLVVAGVFVEQAGENRSRHIGADAVVSEVGAITLSIGGPALSPFFWIILGLRDCCQRAVEGVGR